jgi:hypothetical protein
LRRSRARAGDGSASVGRWHRSAAASLAGRRGCRLRSRRLPGSGIAFEKKIAKRCEGLTSTIFTNGTADVAESVANAKRDLRCANCLFSVISACLGTYTQGGGPYLPVQEICDLADDGIENLSCGTD